MGEYSAEPKPGEEIAMKLRNCVVLGIVMAVGVSCLAQQTTKQEDNSAKTEQKKQAQGAPPPMKPAPEMAKMMKMMVGHWNVTGKIEDEQWAPGGAEGTGTEMIRKGPGGFSVISDGKMDFGKMGPFAGHGVWWWDAGKKAIAGTWCDNWGPACQPAGEGKWEGENLVFTGDMDSGSGTKIPMRLTYSNFSANGFDWKMEIGNGKGGWKPEMSLKYRKAVAKKL
jgi:hypothetical protein